MLFVTNGLVSFFLIALQRGDFYLFFMQSIFFFIIILCPVVRMLTIVR